MQVFDKNQPFGEVIGHPTARFHQRGNYYTGALVFIGPNLDGDPRPDIAVRVIEKGTKKPLPINNRPPAISERPSYRELKSGVNDQDETAVAEAADAGVDQAVFQELMQKSNAEVYNYASRLIENLKASGMDVAFKPSEGEGDQARGDNALFVASYTSA